MLPDTLQAHQPNNSLRIVLYQSPCWFWVKKNASKKLFKAQKGLKSFNKAHWRLQHKFAERIWLKSDLMYTLSYPPWGILSDWGQICFLFFPKIIIFFYPEIYPAQTLSFFILIFFPAQTLSFFYPKFYRAQTFLYFSSFWFSLNLSSKSCLPRKHLVLSYFSWLLFSIIGCCLPAPWEFIEFGFGGGRIWG